MEDGNFLRADNTETNYKNLRVNDIFCHPHSRAICAVTRRTQHTVWYRCYEWMNTTQVIFGGEETSLARYHTVFGRFEEEQRLAYDDAPKHKLDFIVGHPDYLWRVDFERVIYTKVVNDEPVLPIFIGEQPPNA